MDVLVTGATGFIGRRLVPALRTAGHDVDCTSLDVAVPRALTDRPSHASSTPNSGVDAEAEPR